MKKIVLIIIILLTALVFSWVVYINYSARALPHNDPVRFIKSRQGVLKEKVVVCAGDSITHGRVSCNYVDILGRRLAGYEYQMVNAGINGEFAWNLLQRADDIIKCNPAIITIMIGTNDADATLNEEKLMRGMKEFELPKHPTKEWYRENITELCRKLKSETRARIALISIPPIGEDMGDQAFARAKEFSRIIKDVALSENVAYLPLNELMTEYLKKHPSSPKYHFEKLRYVMYRGIIEHHGFGVSYDSISEKAGFVLLTDFLHLNCTGAGLVADLIEGFVKKY